MNGDGKLDLAVANTVTNDVSILLNQTAIQDTRVLHYTYDGLSRLISATEPSAATTYTYDTAGNRTAVWVNSVLRENRSYNAANQVVGYSYDAAGNLTNDGTSTYTYDALNRMTARGSTTYAYNGDGTLVSQTANSVTTRYTQDLAAPLSQMLQIKVGAATPTDYLYGLDRLASLGGSALLIRRRRAREGAPHPGDESGNMLGMTTVRGMGTPRRAMHRNANHRG